jgi:hypothetical protein
LENKEPTSQIKIDDLFRPGPVGRSRQGVLQDKSIRLNIRQVFELCIEFTDHGPAHFPQPAISSIVLEDVVFVVRLTNGLLLIQQLLVDDDDDPSLSKTGFRVPNFLQGRLAPTWIAKGLVCHLAAARRGVVYKHFFEKERKATTVTWQDPRTCLDGQGGFTRPTRQNTS